MYAINELAEIEPIHENTPYTLLYLTEPIRDRWNLKELGEYQAMRYFIENVHFLKLPKSTKFKLRLHPSENKNKYTWLLKEYNQFFEIVNGSLKDQISLSRYVAGCQTYAMTLALKAGRKVFGTLPPWAPSCALPHNNIIQLKNLCL